MKKFTSLIMVISLVMCFCVSVFAGTLPKATITLNGASSSTIEKGTTYVEESATASYIDATSGNPTSIATITTTGVVNKDLVGNYTITYTVPTLEGKYDGTTATRTIKVVDSTIVASTSPTPSSTVSPSASPTISPSTSPSASVKPSASATVAPSTKPSCKPTTGIVQTNNVTVSNVHGDVNITTVNVVNNYFEKGLYMDYNSSKVNIGSKESVKWSGSKKITTNQDAFTVYGYDANGNKVSKTVSLKAGKHDYKVDLVAGGKTTTANVTVDYVADTNVKAEPIVEDTANVVADTLPQTGESTNTGLIAAGIAVVFLGLYSVFYIRLKVKSNMSE
jgi:LPXTG-motif cell wall-anchored protein